MEKTEEIKDYEYPQHITISQALNMLDEIAVDKEGFVATWKLTCIDGGIVYYDLVRDNYVLANIGIPIDKDKIYQLDLANIKGVISADTYLTMVYEGNMRYYIKKDDPLNLQEFLDIYGDYYMSFVKIQHNIITYYNSYSGYTVKIENNVNSQFKEVETANSLYRIVGDGFFEFKFE